MRRSDGRPPQSFRDFSLQFHQDLELVHPGFLSGFPGSLHGLYESFRQQHGDRAVRELAAYFGRLLADEHVHLESLWFRKSSADLVLSEAALRRMFEDFAAWAASLR